MRAAGYEPEDFEGDAIELWPENHAVYRLFSSLGTQWADGFSGRTGLRYEAVYPLLDRLASTPAEWDSLFDEVRAMEAVALQQMDEETSNK